MMFIPAPFWSGAAAGGGGGSGFTWFYAFSPTASGVVGGPALTERQRFDTFLASAPTPEDFEGFADFDPVDGLAGSSNGNSFTMAQDSGFSVVYTNAQGRFNTTSGGSKHADIDFTGATATLTFTFDAPVAAFGCYITDIGEFINTITADINRSGGGSDSYVIAGGEADANLVFWGFVDTGATYTSVVFTISDVSDRVGVDDVILATAAQLA